MVWDYFPYIIRIFIISKYYSLLDFTLRFKLKSPHINFKNKVVIACLLKASFLKKKFIFFYRSFNFIKSYLKVGEYELKLFSYLPRILLN